MIRNGKAIDHSNAGGVGGSLIFFVICFAAFLGSLYAMSFWSLDNAWIPGLIALALAVLTFIIPQGILGRGDTLHTNAIHGAQPLAAQPATAVHTSAARTTTVRPAATQQAAGSQHAAGSHGADRRH
ncbi:hypothetical protein AB0302_05555 [Micrococcus sp. NPDC078436]|uniref:hypothetical protein n=1 Tax=Micrococcus sp. NPDC078436 TaxID=3154960 RepID=UPI00344F3A32